MTDKKYASIRKLGKDGEAIKVPNKFSCAETAVYEADKVLCLAEVFTFLEALGKAKPDALEGYFIAGAKSFDAHYAAIKKAADEKAKAGKP